MKPDDTLLVTVPGLNILQQEGRSVVRNDVLGTCLPCDSRAHEVLAFFRVPRLLGEFLAAGFSMADIEPALAAAAIFDLERLLESAATAPIGTPMSPKQLCSIPETPEFVVLGVRTDSGTSGEPGARNGPVVIRNEWRQFARSFTSTQERLLDLDFRRSYTGKLPTVADLGDVVTLPGEGIATIGARLEMLVSFALGFDTRLVLLGGDHSLTHWSLQAMLRKYSGLGVIHFDAHHDLFPTMKPNMSYVTHYNPFTAALRDPRLHCLRQIGLRMIETARPAALTFDRRLSYVSAREIQTMPPHQVFAELPPDLPYYLSFDIDCLSPDIAPETGAPVAGGLTYYQALELIDYAARNFDLVGFDLVEVAGTAHDASRAGKIAARLALQILLGRTPCEPLTSYLRKE